MDKKLRELIDAVTAKRPRTVLNHIMKSWEGDAVDEYDRVADMAKAASTDLRTLVKTIIRQALRVASED